MSQLVGKGAFAAGGGIDATGSGKVKLARGDVLDSIAAHEGTPKTYGSDSAGPSCVLRTRFR